jgi:dipeptidyl aminopeptidase/acylaminoacyl peptidase
MAHPTTLPRTVPIAFSLLLACFAGPLLPAAKAPVPAPPLAGEVYFKPPEFADPAISLDGKNIAFIAQLNGHACLFRLELKTGQVSGLFSAGEGDVETFWWTGSDRVLLAGRGRSGREYVIQDLANSKPRVIDTLRNWGTDWIKVLPHDPNHIVSYNKRLDVTTGKYTLIENASSDLTPVFSAEGETRAKLWYEVGKWHIAWRARASDSWQKTTCSGDDQPIFIPVGMAANDRDILVIANDQGDTQAIMRLDSATGQRTMIAQRPHHDVSGLVTTGADRRPVGVLFCNITAEDILYFDEADRHFSMVLDQSLPGMLHRVTSSSADGNLRVIQAWFPGYPARYYLFDSAQRRLSMLGDSRPDIAPGVLGEVEIFRFKARDGLDEFGHVLFPSSKVRSGPAPLIVLAVDGAGADPYSASAFNAADQFFASRGYAVAHIDVRGTAGFGRAYAKAGDFELGGKVVHDLEDGIQHLVRTGRIDPQRVAILGYYNSGISALYTAAASTTFRAVIAYNPEGDFTTNGIKWLSTSRADVPAVVQQAGGKKAAYALVHQFEPESFMDRLSAPTLLVCSTWYGRTNNALAKQIKGAFERRHKTFEWYEIDVRDYEHVKDHVYTAQFCTKAADFLDQTLK